MSAAAMRLASRIRINCVRGCESCVPLVYKVVWPLWKERIVRGDYGSPGHSKCSGRNAEPLQFRNVQQGRFVPERRKISRTLARLRLPLSATFKRAIFNAWFWLMARWTASVNVRWRTSAAYCEIAAKMPAATAMTERFIVSSNPGS